MWISLPSEKDTTSHYSTAGFDAWSISKVAAMALIKRRIFALQVILE
jgi:hypothetical protein